MPFAGLMMYAPDPTKAENLNDPLPKCQPGAVQYFNGAFYKYVQFDNGTGNVASVAGNAAFAMLTRTFKVTSDKTSCEHGASVGSGVVGVFMGVVTDLYYTWIQMSGVVESLLVDGAGAVGQVINCPASDGGSNDLHVAAWTTVATQIVGVQIGLVSATRVAAWLMLPIW
jgi:hypothetical protein